MQYIKCSLFIYDVVALASTENTGNVSVPQLNQTLQGNLAFLLAVRECMTC